MRIARFLQSRPDPWMSVPLSLLWEPLGYASIRPLDQQWDVAMGLVSAASRPFAHDKRNPVSPLVVPTRWKGDETTRLVGEKAFRLRFNAPGQVQQGFVIDQQR